MTMMGELAKELAAVYQSLVKVAACAEKERAAENVSAEEAVITKALQTSQLLAQWCVGDNEGAITLQQAREGMKSVPKEDSVAANTLEEQTTIALALRDGLFAEFLINPLAPATKSSLPTPQQAYLALARLNNAEDIESTQELASNVKDHIAALNDVETSCRCIVGELKTAVKKRLEETARLIDKQQKAKEKEHKDKLRADEKAAAVALSKSSSQELLGAPPLQFVEYKCFTTTDKPLITCFDIPTVPCEDFKAAMLNIIHWRFRVSEAWYDSIYSI